MLYDIMIKKLVNLDISPNILAFINNLISSKQALCRYGVLTVNDWFAFRIIVLLIRQGHYNYFRDSR